MIAIVTGSNPAEHISHSIGYVRSIQALNSPRYFLKTKGLPGAQQLSISDGIALSTAVRTEGDVAERNRNVAL
jgi:hypothetical protein